MLYLLFQFDQLIKDEDARLEYLKMMLKIREKALLDRVRAELAWLEIQRKYDVLFCQNSVTTFIF